MEALFSTTLASYEAWLMVFCVIVFFGIYLFDGINFVQRVYLALKPIKPVWSITPLGATDTIPEVTSPILEPIAPEEVQAHEAERAEAEEKHEQEVIKSEVFEEKVLEEIQQAEIEKEVKESEQEVTVDMPTWKEVSLTFSPEANSEWESLVQEEFTQTTVAEETPGDMIENDLKEKQETEKNPPYVTEEEVENLEMIDKVEPAKEIIPVISSEAIVESRDLIQEPTQEETIPQGESEEETDDIKKVEEKSLEDTTSIIEEQAPSEESQPLPITASIHEPITEVRRSSEWQHIERLYVITNEVKTLIARGQSQDARALIIEWLSLDKNHRELNLILGSIYESERQAQKAEYIYKDLALAYPEDGEILERLANILIIEKRYDLALEIYKKIISLSGETEWSLYIMTHLAHELGHHEELYAYARRYQKNWPNNPDILTLLAQAEIALGERQSAIQTLIKLKNLTPYNNEIMETIAKLTMEEELAGNFGGEKIN